MATNSSKSANHAKLVQGKVLHDEAALSAEEDHVIGNLTDQEVDTLVGIRKKLDAKASERATADTYKPSPNFIV